MNTLHHNKYSQPTPTTNQTTNAPHVVIDYSRLDTGTFGMPAQDTIPMQTYRDLWQLWIESRIENEQLHKRVMELEAEKEAGNG